jgi:hypothetical protein
LNEYKRFGHNYLLKGRQKQNISIFQQRVTPDRESPVIRLSIWRSERSHRSNKAMWSVASAWIRCITDRRGLSFAVPLTWSAFLRLSQKVTMAPTNSNETYCTFTLASDVTAGGLPSEQDIAKDLESADNNVRGML